MRRTVCVCVLLLLLLLRLQYCVFCLMGLLFLCARLSCCATLRRGALMQGISPLQTEQMETARWATHGTAGWHGVTHLTRVLRQVYGDRASWVESELG